MFGLVTRRRYETDLAAARATAHRLRTERDTAREQRNAFKHTAETASRQFTDADDQLAEVGELRKTVAKLTAEITVANTRAANLQSVIDKVVQTDRESRPVDGASAAPLPNSTRLRRALAHAKALHERLTEVTAANQNCTCGGAS